MSPARARTSSPAIVAAARELLEEGGLEAVSMANVAGRVGVRAPSLYKRFTDRDDLLAAVLTDAALELGQVLAGAAEGSAAAAGSDSAPLARLEALATAYRSFAASTPRVASLLFASAGGGATPSSESQVEAVRPVLQVAESIVGPTRALAAARVLTAFAYGFTSMESAGAFRLGGEIDEAYRLGLSALASGLERVAAEPQAT